MDFQARVDEELKAAMKARQADRLSVLRMLKTALKNAALDKGGAEARLDDASAQAVVRNEVKRRQDAVESYEKGGRPELAVKEREEMEVLAGFLPRPLSTAELEELVGRALAETGATTKAQMGQVMKRAAELAEGRADGRALSQAVAARLP